MTPEQRDIITAILTIICTAIPLSAIQVYRMINRRDKRATDEQKPVVADADTLSEKRDDALDAMVFITKIFEETRDNLRAELTATQIERTQLRAELAESVATRDLQAGQIASLRIDVDNLKKEAQAREEAHAVALAEARATIREQAETIEAQRKTIEQMERRIAELEKRSTDEHAPPTNGSGDTHPSGGTRARR